MRRRRGRPIVGAFLCLGPMLSMTGRLEHGAVRCANPKIRPGIDPMGRTKSTPSRTELEPPRQPCV